MPVEYPSPGPARGKVSAVCKGQLPFGIFKDTVQHIRHLPVVLPVIDATRGYRRMRDPDPEQLVHRIEFMGEQLADHAHVVIKPFCPVIVPVNTERLVGCCTQPLHPVYGLFTTRFRVAVFIKMPDPGPVGCIPVGGCFDQGDLAEYIPLDDLLCLLKYNVLRDLVTQLEHTVTVPDGIVDFIQFIFSPANAFFAVNMLSGLYCFGCEPGMVMIGCGNENCIYLLVIQQIFMGTVPFGFEVGILDPSRPGFIGRGSQSLLGMQVKNITDPGNGHIQVLLFEPSGQGTILFHSLHPIGLGKPE